MLYIEHKTHELRNKFLHIILTFGPTRESNSRPQALQSHTLPLRPGAVKGTI